jgi:predicted ester cyclase
VRRAKELAQAFFDALIGLDAEAAIGLADPGAFIEVVPANIKGTAAEEGRRFVTSLIKAFPDLSIRLHSVLDTPELAVASVTMEGTQAAGFLGILNQEKHVDVEQAWMFWAAQGKISGIRAYWCQNQLYRRLAVRRLDRISILG